MEIEVGEYVRTKTGLIFKATEYWLSELTEEIKENIKTHSKNIIDLIEVGDYVNRNIVYEVLDDEIELLVRKIRKKRLHFISGHLIDEENIKSIVTKEQFKNIEYIVEE